MNHQPVKEEFIDTEDKAKSRKTKLRSDPKVPSSVEEDDSESTSEDESYQPCATPPKVIQRWGKRTTKKKRSTAKPKIPVNTFKGKPRGNYNMLNLDQRLQILTYAKRYGIDQAHNKYKICKSRIRRYLNNGADRKKGGGRKPLILPWRSTY